MPSLHNISGIGVANLRKTTDRMKVGDSAVLILLAFCVENAVSFAPTQVSSSSSRRAATSSTTARRRPAAAPLRADEISLSLFARQRGTNAGVVDVTPPGPRHSKWKFWKRIKSRRGRGGAAAEPKRTTASARLGQLAKAAISLLALFLLKPQRALAGGGGFGGASASAMVPLER